MFGIYIVCVDLHFFTPNMLFKLISDVWSDAYSHGNQFYEYVHLLVASHSTYYVPLLSQELQNNDSAKS